jgi:competence protein ComGC
MHNGLKLVLKIIHAQLEYFQIAEEETLIIVNLKKKNKKHRAFIAVLLIISVLIDTILLN